MSSFKCESGNIESKMWTYAGGKDDKSEKDERPRASSISEAVFEFDLRVQPADL